MKIIYLGIGSQNRGSEFTLGQRIIDEEIEEEMFYDLVVTGRVVYVRIGSQNKIYMRTSTEQPCC